MFLFRTVLSFYLAEQRMTGTSCYFLPSVYKFVFKVSYCHHPISFWYAGIFRLIGLEPRPIRASTSVQFRFDGSPHHFLSWYLLVSISSMTGASGLAEVFSYSCLQATPWPMPVDQPCPSSKWPRNKVSSEGESQLFLADVLRQSLSHTPVA